MPTEKLRLDELLVSRGFSSDIKSAHNLILSGSVLIDDRVVDKVGLKFKIDCNLRIKEMIGEYVGRGALKLKPVLEKWEITLENRVCVDLGASTGGFTQIMLEKMASKVYAIDVGYGILAGKLRNDPRVQVVDRFHAKNLNWEVFESTETDLFFTMDLSFISVLKIFPAIVKMKQEKSSAHLEGLCLIKPQFEAKPDQLEKGIIQNPFTRFVIIKNVIRSLSKNIQIKNLTQSPLPGAEGNIEYFVHWGL